MQFNNNIKHSHKRIIQCIIQIIHQFYIISYILFYIIYNSRNDLLR